MFSSIPLVSIILSTYNKTMKNAIFFLASIVVIILLGLNITFMLLQQEAEPIIQGAIDSSHIDFHNSETTWLRGEWDFIPEQFSDPSEFRGSTTPFNTESITVPAAWHSNINSHLNMERNSFGTYHLQIKIPEDSGQLGIYIPWINTAYSCYIDEELMIEVGTPGKDRQSHEPQYLPAVFNFMPEGNTFDIVLHVSNFSHRDSGLMRPIIFGSSKSISRLFQTTNNSSIFLSGIMFMGTAFLLMLYASPTENRRLLYIAVLTAAIGIRTTLGNTMVMNQVFPFIPWSVSIRIEYITVPIAIIAFTYYIAATFPDFFSRKILSIFKWISFLYCIIIITTPHTMYGLGLKLYYILIVIYFLYWLYIMIKGHIWKNTNNQIIFITATVFGIFTLIDLLAYSADTQKFIPIEFSSIGLFVFIFGEVYIAAEDFIKALKTSQELTQELEIKVNERTLKLKEANQKLYRMASMDDLTGLWNRNELQKRTEEESYRHNRYYNSVTPFFSVLYMDLDNFKYFNDTFTHDTGDFILREFGKLLVKSSRRSDSIFRVGGDEFIMFLPRTDTAGAIRISRRILEGITDINKLVEKREQALAEEGKSIELPVEKYLTCSIGIGIHGYKELNIERLIQYADTALLKAKETGKNRYYIFNSLNKSS